MEPIETGGIMSPIWPGNRPGPGEAWCQKASPGPLRRRTHIHQLWECGCRRWRVEGPGLDVDRGAILCREHAGRPQESPMLLWLGLQPASPTG